MGLGFRCAARLGSLCSEVDLAPGDVDACSVDVGGFVRGEEDDDSRLLFGLGEAAGGDAGDEALAALVADYAADAGGPGEARGGAVDCHAGVGDFIGGVLGEA